jgi:hypothetical protein
MADELISRLLAAGHTREEIAGALAGLATGGGGPSLGGPAFEEVTPTPAFVIKSAVVSLEASPRGLPPAAAVGVKVFLNVTHHGAVPPLATRPDEAGGSAVSVPMALGEVREERDKQGAPCLAADVIVHPSVAGDAARDGTGAFRHWLADFCLQYFARKHGAALSPAYSLPAVAANYKGGGGVRSQRLRKAKVAVVDGEGVAGGGGGGGRSGGAGAPAPLSLLAEAGALHEGAMGLVPGGAAAGGGSGGGGARRPRGPPVRAPPPAALDIRLVAEEREREAAGVAGRVAAELKAADGDEGGGAPLPSLLLRSGVGGAGGGAQPGGAAIGLTAGATRRAPKPIGVAVALLLRDGGEVPCALTPAGGGGGGGGGGAASLLFLAAAPPSAGAPPPADVVSLRVAFSLPPPHGLPASALRLSARGGGAELRLSVESSDAPVTPLSLSLPMRCDVVEASDDGAAAAVTATWDSRSGVLQLRLAPAAGEGGGGGGAAPLPPLPAAPANGDDPAVAAVLRAYVEAGAAPRFEPDVGSRQWLFAQAMAAGEGGGGAQAAAVVGPAPAPAAGSGGDAPLPEDRFHAADALSMHYIRLREEELAKRRAKEAEEPPPQPPHAPAQPPAPPSAAALAALLTDLL